MFANRCSVCDLDWSWSDGVLQVPFQEFLWFFFRIKADILAFLVLRWEGNSNVSCTGNGVRFPECAQWEECPGECFLRERVEEVRLALPGINAFEETVRNVAVTTILHDACVVACGDLVALQFVCHVQQYIEFDHFIADDARVRSSSFAILLKERFNYFFLECILQINVLQFYPEHL